MTENPRDFDIWFDGRERKARMPNKFYGDHSIGDRCSAGSFYKDIPEAIGDSWRNFKIRKIKEEHLSNLREFIRKGGRQAEALSEFSLDTIFDPNEYPSGTILLLGKEYDRYVTLRFEKPELVFNYKNGQHPEKEVYNDAISRGWLFGVIIRLADSKTNILMEVWGSEEKILSKKMVEVSFVEKPISIGEWIHIVGIGNIDQVESGYYYKHPDIITPYAYRILIPDSEKQIDIFSRYTKIEVLVIGKRVKEKKQRSILSKIPLLKAIKSA